MEFNFEDLTSGGIALALVFLFGFVIYAILNRDDDVGNVVTKKISNQSMFLLEVLLVLINGAEMLTAVSIQASNTEFEVSYGGRLVLHASLAIISIIGGFSFTKNLKEAMANPKKVIQWIQALLALTLVVGGPIINLIIMAYAMNQLGELTGYADIEQWVDYSDGTGAYEWVSTKVGFMSNLRSGALDPTLFATFCITVFHILLIIVISVVAYDKVYTVAGDKIEDDKKDKKGKKDKKDKDKDKDKKGKKKLELKESCDLMSKALGSSISSPAILALIAKHRVPDNMRGRVVNLSTQYSDNLNYLERAKDSGNSETIKKAKSYCESTEAKFKDVLKELKI